MGSRENLKSPQSPLEGQPGSDWGPPGSSRKNSLVIDSITNRRQSVQDMSSGEHQQTTSEMFKDLLSQKRNMFLSKLTSFDGEVSIPFLCLSSFTTHVGLFCCVQFVLIVAFSLF